MTKELAEKQERIKSTGKRIKNHVFVTDDEVRLVDDITEKLTHIELSQDSAQVINRFEEIVKKIDYELIERESAPEERTKEIKIFGTGLDDLEASLLLSIDKEQAAQNGTSKIFTAILIVGIVIVASILIRLAFQSEPTWVELSGQMAALLSSVFVLLILSRLTQSAREAAERMDEKAVAIKFIRYGLKIQMERPDDSDMLKAGIEMFLGHQSNKSQPVSRDDFNDFANAFKSVAKQSQSK